MLTIDGFLQLVHALCCKSHNFEALFSCKTCSKINDNRPQCSKFNKNTEKKANLQSSLAVIKITEEKYRLGCYDVG